MLVAAGKGGVNVKEFLERSPRLESTPFTSERQNMATLHESEPWERGSIVLVKGSVERILRLCYGQMGCGGETIPIETETVLRAAHALAATGLRVLATAMMRLDRHTRRDILIGGTLPILPTQILWINMTTAVALGPMLAFEPREPG